MVGKNAIGQNDNTKSKRRKREKILQLTPHYTRACRFTRAAKLANSLRANSLSLAQNR